MQLRESSEWDALVERAFQALDGDRCGRISREDLKPLLCVGDLQVTTETDWDAGWPHLFPLGPAIPCQGRPVACQELSKPCRAHCAGSQHGWGRPLCRAPAPQFAQHAACRHCRPQAPDELERAFREADINHDGAIDLKEFRRLLSSQLGDKLSLFESRLLGRAGA